MQNFLLLLLELYNKVTLIIAVPIMVVIYVLQLIVEMLRPGLEYKMKTRDTWRKLRIYD